MRDAILPEPNLVSLREAFDTIGSRIFDRDWSGDEAATIRLGQRPYAEPDVRGRGLDALGAMRFLAENGVLDLIYTDHTGRRVPYFESAGHWLSAIYPDPNGTGEGLIELDDRDLHHCVANVAGLKRWRPRRGDRLSTGPVRKYSVFETACEQFFRTHGTGLINEAVWQHAKSVMHRDDPWPKKSWGNALINRARDRQAQSDRSPIPD